MQMTEQKLAKENEQLKLELEALRQRTGSPSSSATAATSAPAAVASIPTNASGTPNLAALAAAQEAARQQIQAQANAHSQNGSSAQQQQQHQQSLFAAAGIPPHMHHLAAAAAAGMPIMPPHMPNAAAMAQIAAAAAAGNLQQQHQQHGQAQQQQQQAAAAAAAAAQQFHASQLAAAAAASAQAPGSGSELFPGSAGFFSGLFNAGGAFDTLESARSESGSPASHGSFGSQASSSGNAAFANALFDMPSMNAFANENVKSTGSPTASSVGGGAAYNLSPPGTVASLAGSERTQQSQNSSSSSTGGASSSVTTALTHNGSAPSPASSNGVPTPSSNAYSPIGLSHITAMPQSTHAQVLGGNSSNSLTDPVIAAFDGSSEVAYLASQFAPSDLAKAQHDLQAFIAYQQRMAFAPSSQPAGPHTPAVEHGRQPSAGAGSPSMYPPSSATAPSFGFSHQQQQHIPPFGGNASLVAGMCGPSAAQAGMNGMPAWQMMMAQHQAMVAAYGGQQF
ncbi:hypothetical protein P389DRAFT_16576 [Cystobasidium minutum MCA 4210]|uniref:uncharacterized protein n=1 Tax=Cystobasidium minutum MCA 4210 TaxID=1397322 RepID=UPI0034CDB7F1|eukprot:jgi/Rhomi1/16576/CE16575_7965